MTSQLGASTGLAPSPTATDRTPRVTVVIENQEYDRISEYEISTDVLALGDAAGVTIPNPSGLYTGKIKMGELVKVSVADPDVAGGKATPLLRGRVISRKAKSARNSGSVVQVGIADLGWHLQSTCGPLWYRTTKTWDQILTDLLDPSWQFQGTRAENKTNRRLNQGRAGLLTSLTPKYKAIPPVFQFEPGETIAEKLIEYAKRDHKLINVSSDGYLQIWSPDYNQEASYKFELYPDDDPRAERNNVETADLDENIEGLYSEVQCVSEVLLPPKTGDTNNPNEGKYKGVYNPPTSPLPFRRLFTFSDFEQIGRDKAKKRAQWRYERGVYDSWTYTVEVKGHSQRGKLFAIDTLAEVVDEVNGVNATLYVSAVKFRRTRRDGTRTVLTLKPKGLLAA